MEYQLSFNISDFHFMSITSSIIEEISSQKWWIIAFIIIGFITVLFLSCLVICKLFSGIKCLVLKYNTYKNEKRESMLNNEFGLTNRIRTFEQFNTDAGYIYESDYNDNNNNNESITGGDENTVNSNEPLGMQFNSFLINDNKVLSNDLNDYISKPSLSNLSSCTRLNHDHNSSHCHTPQSSLMNDKIKITINSMDIKEEQIGGLTLLREIEQIVADRAINDLKRKSINLEIQLDSDLDLNSNNMTSSLDDIDNDIVDTSYSESDDDNNTGADSDSKDDSNDDNNDEFEAGSDSGSLIVSKEIDTILENMVNNQTA